MHTEGRIEEVRQRFRAEMPVAQRWAYLDHAAVAPLSRPALEAITRWSREASEAGDIEWLRWANEVERTRRIAARLLGASPTEIALLPSTTAGINLVAEGLAWQSGDNVVTLDDEFPSNLYPWMHLGDRGVETRRVPTDRGRVDLDRLADACDEQTRVVTVSWIGYATGCRRDLAAIGQIARDHEALFFVDGIQGVGAFPVDVDALEIDFLAADGHKWQLGPEGAGIAYIRQERLPLLRPTGVGWNSVQHAHDFSRIELNLKDDASRYEGGSQNMAGQMGLGASLKLLESLEIANVAASILAWTDAACERLREIDAEIASPRTPEESSGILAFELPGCDPQALRRKCLAAGVALACRDGRLRISAHGYNDQEDLDRLINALRG